MPGRADHAARKLAARKGREKGCSVYIDAETLAEAGIDPDGPPPFYRVWAGSKRDGGLYLRLYKER